MKYILKNIVIILAIILLTSCSKQGNKDIISSKEKSIVNQCDSVSNYSDKCINKHDDSNPDYVPPCDGGVNEKWCNNRHRMLTNDSNCYFRRGNLKK